MIFKVNEAHPEKRVSVWFMDEARFGLKPITKRKWAPKGERPSTVKVLVMDRVGWHSAKSVNWHDNILPIWLPPYSPELNPVERL